MNASHKRIIREVAEMEASGWDSDVVKRLSTGRPKPAAKAEKPEFEFDVLRRAREAHEKAIEVAEDAKALGKARDAAAARGDRREAAILQEQIVMHRWLFGIFVGFNQLYLGDPIDFIASDGIAEIRSSAAYRRGDADAVAIYELAEHLIATADKNGARIADFHKSMSAAVASDERRRLV